MQQIAPVLGAAPSAAHVTFRQKTEPVWDSCDGEPGTFGWDNVTVLAEFRGGGSPTAIVHRVRDAMRHLGWIYRARFSGRGIWYWYRSLSNGKLARAELDGPSQGTDKWDLLARAQPSARRVRGC
ncbi:MAG TPA: hypothetical protein VFH38_10415 [Jatrophihabitans sp.]|nr:hypothetical protein [Jatrophihabitans sp.]